MSLISFEKIIDKYVFSIPCIFKANKIKTKQINKILVVKLWALGDSVVLLPTIEALRKHFPKAQIDILAHKRNKVVFEGQKSINNIIDFGIVNILKLFRKYDLCIDAEPFLNVSAVIALLSSRFRLGFNHGIRSRLYNEKIHFNKKQHMMQNYLDFARKLGIKYNTDKLVPLLISQNDKKIVSNFLKTHNLEGKLNIALVPGVAESVKYRMWPLENFAMLADELIRLHNANVIFVDSKSNEETVKKIQSEMNEKSINAAGHFTVKQSAELLKHCKVVVSNDSGMMHVSAAQGARTIGLFGPNTPVLWAPYGKSNISLFKPKKGCPFIDNIKPELIPKYLTEDQLTCMDAISVNDVLKAVEKLIR